MSKPGRTRRPTAAQVRAYTDYSRAMEAARNIPTTPPRRSLRVVHGLRRVLQNPDEIMDALDLDPAHPLINVGFYRHKPPDQRDTSVGVVASGLALQIGHRFEGSSSDFAENINKGKAGLPSQLTGTLGNVGIRGTASDLKIKRVGWYLD